LLALDVSRAGSHGGHVGRRADRDRSDGVGTDAIFPFFGGNRPHQRCHPGLRHGVCRAIGARSSRKSGLGSEEHDGATSGTQHRQERSGGEIGRREIDRNLSIPDVEGAFGHRATHREATRHVHEGMQFGAVLATNRFDERRNAIWIGEVAAIPTCDMATRCEVGRASGGVLGHPIDERHGRTLHGERLGHDFPHLPFSADPGEQDSRHSCPMVGNETHALPQHKHDTIAAGEPEPSSAWHGPCTGSKGMSRLRRIGLIITVVCLLGLALIGVLTITRGTPVGAVVTLTGKEAPAITDSLFERTFELFTGTHVFAGNRVQQELNGDSTYPRLWADLRSAQHTITVQMYYSLPGKVADSMAAVLKERARANVRVLFLVDAFGSQHLANDWLQSLRDAGVEVAKLRPLRWYTIHNAADRSHVRVVVIDGRTAYTGGFGLADYWLGDGHHDEQWRESNVRFEGPAVMQLQAAFAAAWAEATGELITGRLFFPNSGFEPVGTTHAGVLFTAPTTGSPPAELFIVLTIASARRTLYITNSYFVPDDDFRRMLEVAVKRGVDVRVLTVSDKTDVKTTWYAGRHWYEELLRAGVKIFEYQPTMMHSKTIVADGIWSSIGSMNFDNRSMSFNNESNLVVLDTAFGAQMDSVFRDDLRYSKEIRLAEFQRRSLWAKAIETLSAMAARLL
jgi:cardiolipin synthase